MFNGQGFALGREKVRCPDIIRWFTSAKGNDNAVNVTLAFAEDDGRIPKKRVLTTFYPKIL